MRGIWIALALVTACKAWADSKPPTPAPTKCSQPQQALSSGTDNCSAYNQRGTDIYPFTVKILPLKDAEKKSADEANDRNEKALNDEAIIKFNRRLIIIGWLQLAAFIGQLFVFGYQALKLRQTVALSERTERPYLFLGMVNGYVFPDAIGQRLGTLAGRSTKLDELPAVAFNISNSGRSPAILKEIHTALIAFDVLPEKPDYNLCWIRPGERILSAGETSEVIKHMNDDKSFHSYADGYEEVKKLYSKDTCWVFFGFIKYEDVAGDEHITGFGMRAIPDNIPNAFTSVGGKAYNYRK